MWVICRLAWCRVSGIQRAECYVISCKAEKYGESGIDLSHGLGAQSSDNTTDSAAREGLDVIDCDLGVLPEPVCCSRLYQHTDIGHSQKIACNQGYSDQFIVPWKLSLNDERRTRLAEVSRGRDRNHGTPCNPSI
jgi:hypothetical protein